MDYVDQNFPCSIKVCVTFESSGDSFVDWVKGLNSGHALYRARWNWEGATITILEAAK
jgi:hypothetical protein